MSRRMVVTFPSTSIDIARPDSIMALSHGAQPLSTAQQRCYATILTGLVLCGCTTRTRLRTLVSVLSVDTGVSGSSLTSAMDATVQLAENMCTAELLATD